MTPNTLDQEIADIKQELARVKTEFGKYDEWITKTMEMLAMRRIAIKELVQAIELMHGRISTLENHK